MDRKIYGIFVAGGKGVRMGSDTPKQFLELRGIPVLQRTVERFVEAVPSMDVICVLPSEHIPLWNNLCTLHNFECPQRIVKGGITRFHSVRNALKQVPDGALVMIHDGVRPLCSRELIARMLKAMETERAAVPATPVTDTLRSLDPDVPSPDRSRLVSVQTPQCFMSEDIRKAYSLPYDPSFTDDASVISRMGIPVTLVEGDRYNIKITTPEDLAVAEALTSC